MALDRRARKAIDAAMAGDLGTVAKYLDGSGDPNVADLLGRSILLCAVGASQVQVVELLLDRGALLTEPAIQRAKDKDHPAMLGLLASRGVPVKYVPFAELPQSEKDARLFKAIRDARFEDLAGTVERMVAEGASLEARQNDRTPLMVLADDRALFTDAAKAMIRLGADVAATDDAGRTALHKLATQGSGIDFASALLAAGLNVDVRDAAGRTPLHAAAESIYHSSQRMVELLVERGAALDASDAQGKRPRDLASGDVRTWLLARTATPLPPLDAELLRAVTDGRLAEVKALLAQGASPCAVDLSETKYGAFNLSGVSALHAAMFRNVPIEVALALLDAPTLDANVCDVEGRTALHHAVGQRGAPDRRPLVERLVARGADPTRRDGGGETAVCSLISFHELQDELEVFQYFEARGLDLSDAKEGFTLVDEMYQRMQRFSEISDKKGFTTVFRFLIDRGVKTREPNMQKWAAQWLTELEAKYVTKTQGAAARTKTAVDFAPLGKRFGEEAHVSLRGQRRPVAFFDWPQLVVDGANDLSEHASTIAQYHVAPTLEDLVAQHQLVPIGVVGMTGTLDSFAEEMTDGTLYVDLRETNKGDAPVLYQEGDDAELELVEKSFKAFVKAIEAKPKRKR